ncbi:MAG: WYL domain-containing protein [Chitinophagales bacterium]|nr:WYL domain-containing protein [Chitinophagales bacterium]
MPVNKEAFLRYRILDRMLRTKNKPFPTMDDFLEVLEEKLGKTFSVSTVQKDIKSMKEDELLGYKAPIKFHRMYNGYYYTDPNFSITEVPLSEEDLDAIEFAALVLQQFKEVKLFGEFGSAVDKIFNAVNVNSILGEEDSTQYIQFEKVPFYKGSEWIAPLLEYIKQRQTIVITYQRFEVNEAKEHEVHPILLKEFRNRWYLIAMLEKNDRIVTYALDRISECKASNIPYRFHAKFSAENYFKHAYGITTFEEEPSEIILECSPIQAAYFKTQALHDTQKILEEKENFVRLSLRVGLTTEFLMDLLSFGSAVRVIEPLALKLEIKKRLEEALQAYQ